MFLNHSTHFFIHSFIHSFIHYSFSLFLYLFLHSIMLCVRCIERCCAALTSFSKLVQLRMLSQIMITSFVWHAKRTMQWQFLSYCTRVDTPTMIISRMVCG